VYPRSPANVAEFCRFVYPRSNTFSSTYTHISEKWIYEFEPMWLSSTTQSAVTLPIFVCLSKNTLQPKRHIIREQMGELSHYYQPQTPGDWFIVELQPSRCSSWIRIDNSMRTGFLSESQKLCLFLAVKDFIFCLKENGETQKQINGK